jgi:antibiotic biosynthesis monooxygenase (ABM) superfamily enzyme
MNSYVDEENLPVTVIVSRLVKPGCEQAYEQWIKGISREAMQFEGHLGVSIIRPQKNVQPEYVMIFKFDRYSNLKKWVESDVRQEWLDKTTQLVQGEANVQMLTGMEAWFTLPDKPLPSPPPRYKMLVVTWLTVYVLINIITFVLGPVLRVLPHPLSSLILSLLMVSLMTYFVMPFMTRLFYKWLYPSR